MNSNKVNRFEPVRDGVVYDFFEKNIYNTRTSYLVFNNNLPLDAETIIMIHGFRGDFHGFLKIAYNFDDYRIIIPDLPGFGNSGVLPEETNLFAYISWLKEFCNTAMAQFSNSAKFHLVAHSFGTIISAHAFSEIDFANKFDSLSLLNPISSYALSSNKIIQTSLARAYYFLGKIMPEKLAIAWLKSRTITRLMSQLMVTTKNKELRKYIHNEHRLYFSRFASRESLLAAFEVSIAYNVTEIAHKILLPTLIIAGSKDPISDLATQQKLKDLLSNAKLEVASNVGHLLHYEADAFVAENLRKFFHSGMSNKI